MVNIQMCKVKRQHEQRLAIEDYEFVVIADQVVGGARDNYSSFKETHLQGSKMLFSAAINVGDERSYFDASSRGGFKLRLNVRAIKI